MQALVYHGPGKLILEDKPKSIIIKKRIYSYCESDGRWILKDLLDGAQAETVQVAFADITPNAMRDAETAMLLGAEQRERVAQAMPTRPMNEWGKKQKS